MKFVKCIYTVLMLELAAAVCFGQDDDTVKAKAEFNKLVIQRNQMIRQLDQLDQKALTSMKKEESTVKFNAQQVGSEDKLDLIQLRMETLAARYGFVIPPPPQKDDQGRYTDELKYGLDAFARGKTRTHDQLKLETLRLLAALDFTGVKSKLSQEK